MRRPARCPRDGCNDWAALPELLEFPPDHKGRTRRLARNRSAQPPEAWLDCSGPSAAGVIWRILAASDLPPSARPSAQTSTPMIPRTAPSTRSDSATAGRSAATLADAGTDNTDGSAYDESVTTSPSSARYRDRILRVQHYAQALRLADSPSSWPAMSEPAVRQRQPQVSRMAERVGLVPSAVSESEPREAWTPPELPTTEPKVREWPFDSLRSLRAFSVLVACHERTCGSSKAAAGESNGGEGGIRTHVPVTRQHAFEARPLRPLRYLSVEGIALKRTVDYSAGPRFS